MRSTTPTRRLRTAIAALMATVFSTATLGASAVAESESPFGDAVRVADNALDTMRGGFSGSDGGMLRFGVNLETSVNGQPITSVSISNDAQGKIHGTVRNLGRTFVLQPDGSVQIKSTIPAGGTSSSITTQNAKSSVGVTSLPTSVTMQLSNPGPNSTPSPGNASSVIVTTTLVPTLPSSVPNGAVLASTGLLPNGNGVMTLIQNTQSNVVIHALNTLNIQISGVGKPLPHSSVALHGFSRSMNFSVRR
jgi:hypothetical protein